MWLIFDGLSGSEKKGTEQEREANRAIQVRLGLRLQAEGDYDGSIKAFQSALDINPDIAMQVIEHLRGLPTIRRKELGLQGCYTALGEADPLLTFVHKRVKNSCILSSDYDNIPWGADRVLLKVDYITGTVDLFDREVFKMTATVGKHNLLHVTDDQLIDICVLAGCDYYPSLRGIGFAKAFNVVIEKSRGTRVLYAWRQQGLAGCDDVYYQKALRAFTLFRYQRVSVCMYVCMYVCM